MANRQEEKQRRRDEREAREREAASAASRRRLVQIASGVVLAVAAVVVVVIAVVSGGGGGGSGQTATANTAGTTIPKPQISDLTQAAQAAGCQLRDYPNFGQQHTQSSVTYKTNPPTSGPHNPAPAPDGIYNPGQEPAKEHYVHSLEHGRIEYQYKPGTPANEIKQLEVLFNEPLKSRTGQGAPNGYKKVLFQNDTGMPFAVAGVAWQHLIGCPAFNPRVFDALRDFSVKYVDLAPESQSIPFPE